MSERPTNGRPPAEPDSLLDAAGVPRGPLRTPRAYKICDGLSEGLIFLMVIFSPWAFATTQNWSIWTMNWGGYALGLVLAVKWVIRWKTDYHPARWGESAEIPHAPQAMRVLTGTLAFLTILILAWCLVSVLNPRATYTHNRRAFEYFECIRWLPHSYDSASSWFAFWQYLGLACFFWALRDWLLGKTSEERRLDRDANEEPSLHRADLWPLRLKRLLWILCINGGILGLVCILQRLSGTEKLLWFMKSRWGTGDTHLGPFNYRSNGAQYLNLLWPVCLGFWWSLRREAKAGRRFGARAGSGAHSLLIPCAVLMAVATVMSTSRGGVLVAGGLITGVIALLILATPRRSLGTRLGVISLLIAAVALGMNLGWKKLAARLTTATKVLPTAYDVGTQSFSVRVIADLSGPETNTWQTWLALSDHLSKGISVPRSFQLVLHPNGSLRGMIHNDSGGVASVLTLTNFARLAGTGVVDVVFNKAGARTTAYVNGKPAGLSLSPRGSEKAWDGEVASARLFAGGQHVGDQARTRPLLGAALYNHTLEASEVAASVKSGLRGVEGGVGRRLFASDFNAGPGGLTAGDGATLARTDVGVETTRFALQARRDTLGPLRIVRNDEVLAPGERARFSARLENPNPVPFHVAASWGTWSASPTLVSNTSIVELLWIVSNSSTAPWTSISLDVVDAEGRPRTNLANASLILHHMETELLGPVVALDFSDNPFRSQLNTSDSGREEIYVNAREIAADFPWFGTGPGTFKIVSQLYRDEIGQGWAAYVHDDWLETRVTFGWIGYGIILLMLVLIVARRAGSGGISIHWALWGIFALVLAGCLGHARHDFPFQIYSILHLFLVWCAVLSCVGRKS